MTLLRRSFLASLSLLLGSISALAQVPLGSGTYTQTFDSMAAPSPGPVASLPPGWSVFTGATASSLGTSGVTTPAGALWSGTTGQWQNCAAASAGSSATTAQQNAATDRALAIRQSGSFGDPGAAAGFNFSTNGQQVTAISFSAQMLSVQTRSTVWSLQYGLGASPTTWVTIGTYSDPGAFGSTLVSASGFGSALDNQPNVWVRVVALASSTGSGSRDTFGIDNFTIATSAISAGTPPTIDVPPGDQTVTEGTTVQFMVSASGDAPLSYQWFKGASQLSDINNITGSSTSTLQLANVTVSDGGGYSVLVTNAAGNASASVNLTVNPLLVPPSITTQPSSQVVATGGTANFTVGASGTAPLSYQWRKDGVALVDGATVSGANTNSLTVSSVTADAAGAYDVVVSGVSPSATSNIAILAVPALITPTSQIAYTGGSYATSFDSLPSTGTVTLASAGPLGLDAAPINAGNLGGWSLAKYAGSGSVALFRIESGSGTSGSVYSFGSTSSSERALGSLSSGTTISRFGATLVNGTGQTITQVTVAYTGEQWRRGTGAANKLAFEYALDPTNLNTGAFTAAASLDFTAPVTSGSGTALDGNAPANRVRISSTLTGLNWAPGQVLVLRWTDVDDTGSDDGLAIDNLVFSTPISTTATLPAVLYTTPADGTVNIATNTAISVMFNKAVNFGSSSLTLAGTTSGSHTASVSGGPQGYTVSPDTAFAEDEDVTFTILAAQVTDAATSTQNMAADFTASYITFSTNPRPIHKVQGSGLTSPYAGYSTTVQGVVVASFQAVGQIGGFYIEAPDAEHDANPATSEGIYVFDNANSVSVGDLVALTGTVAEFGTAPATGTEITSLTAFNKISTGNPLPTAAAVTLPFASATDAERYEGMLVTLPQTLTVTNNFDYGIFGELTLSNGRLNTPTNVVSPGAAAQALDAANKLNQIAFDDGLSGNFPDPTPFLADSGGNGLTRRTGSTVAGATGILDNKFGGYIVEATATPTFIDTNARGTPPAVGGTLKVAIGNVLNFFNGNGSGLDGAAGGFPTSRGASNLAEYQRQRAKLIAGITAVAPDIMGLTEVENDRVSNGLADSYGPTSAIADIVNGLNAAAPVGTSYAYVNAAAVDIVTDVIHCAFIYRVETVAPVGAPAMLNDPAFSNVARNPLAQTFRQISNNQKLTVSINHFRAKGSVAAGAGNTDSGDGQGNNNGLRVLESNALVAWLATDPTGSGDPDFLIIGDLNAYAHEDPLTALENAGYVNLTEAAEGVGGWSYQFGGAFGHLDHALASDHLAGQVVDAATWHVNSDEPEYYDYNTEDKSPAQQAINVGTPYRYSDHDPVVVGLNLQPDPAADVSSQIQITRGGFLRNRTTGRYAQTITVKNIGSTPYVAPVSLVFDNLSSNATLYGATGFTSVVTPLGSAYVDLNIGADNVLSPGETVTRVVEFTNPSNQGISYSNRVLAGPGGR
ncbi:MAG TPA: ExeM/NucH family extracellular endonuclease [Lacunisphaera sp.]|nr:ExeM/NucH family extracellular endonuclease [Lacunisphaera sp.]